LTIECDHLGAHLRQLRQANFLASYHITEALFLQILAEAANDARKTIVVAERRTQAQDHPILLTMPETHYLKCLIVRAI
jgi:23S rRNA (cytosine1962-C5)-methyltransferase